jgi:hypothetical protein
MNSISVSKLLKAGYIFIRERDIVGKDGRTSYAIMQSASFGSWTLLEKFATKAARKRKLAELEKSPLILY